MSYEQQRPTSNLPVIGDVEALVAAAAATASTYQKRDKAGGFAHTKKVEPLPPELMLEPQPDAAHEFARDFHAQRMLFVGFRRVATGRGHTNRAMASITAVDAVTGNVAFSTYVCPSAEVESCLGPLTGVSLRDLTGPAAVKEAALKPVVTSADDLVGADVTLVVLDTAPFVEATGIIPGRTVRAIVDFDDVFAYTDPLFFSRSRFHLHHLACIEGVSSPVTADEEARALRWLCLKYGRRSVRETMQKFVVSALRTVPTPTKEEMLLNRCDGVCLCALPSRCTCKDGPLTLRRQNGFERAAES
eukprot:CAMPEP_0174860482 /NCGR_PEP_ID=MMETSP1114-20130205/49283_1 /TAXON_ID=312471 /ORGANISM="Neobodo designis, Strain CCAP 1951/1" /LENGTH=302 /DNA_ID=CAMNT_0016095461 /DNA_START=392 /DNA_END=1297 /DNA_ORIENTATION=+